MTNLLLWTLASVQMSLQIIDSLLTTEILARGGRELNPLLRALGNKWIPVKFAFSAAVTAFFVYLKTTIGLGIIDAAMAGVVIWNLWQLKKR